MSTGGGAILAILAYEEFPTLYIFIKNIDFEVRIYILYLLGDW